MLKKESERRKKRKRKRTKERGKRKTKRGNFRSFTERSLRAGREHADL
jgi:hypothetical protein